MGHHLLKESLEHLRRRGPPPLLRQDGPGLPFALLVGMLLVICCSTLRSSQHRGLQQRGRSMDPPQNQGARQESGRYFKEELGGEVTLEMVYIPGGEFMMGSNEKPSEQPVHRVVVKPFWMGRYEVTREQWFAIDSLPPVHRRRLGSVVRIPRWDQFPVDAVSWDEAQEFCLRLKKKTGKGYRLPTEAEWEYACRAGTTTRFSYGDELTPQLANYNSVERSGQPARGDVGTSGPSNGFGLYDMHGNVAEWVEDREHLNYIGAPGHSAAWITSGTRWARGLRGGSFLWKLSMCRCSARFFDESSRSASGYGFRVVADAQEE